MSSRRVQGRLKKLSPEHKARRLAIRKCRKNHAVRVWSRRHIKKEV